MKKIINGKVYNTETAARIACKESMLPRSDFGWWYEELYRTKKGRYFVFGEGHAASRWCTPIGNNGRGPGEGIEVLTESEALEWCERNGIKASIIEANFTVEEG